MDKKNKEVAETQDTELVETEPKTNSEDNKTLEETGISDKYLAHLDFVSKNIDRFVAAKQKIWSAILRLAKAGDWVVFESKDDNSPTGKRSSVCLSGAGADRIASSIGISFTNWKETKDVGNDEKGNWYRYWFECDCSFGTRTIRVMGRAGSRDKFFGMAHGEMKELSEIDESNIRMAAFHNTLKEGVKLLLGLRNIPVEEFEKAGIRLSYARRVEFKKPNGVETAKKVFKGNEQITDELYCQCGNPIDKRVYDYSTKHFGRPLCRDCQTEASRGVNQ